MVCRMRSVWLCTLLFSIAGCTATTQNIEPNPDTYSQCYIKASTTNESANICVAPYAIFDPKFPYQAYRDHLTGVNHYTFAALWNTFGTETKFVRSELADPRCDGMELTLFNETCVTRGDCGPYETLYGYTSSSLGSAINKDDPKLKARVIGDATNAMHAVLPLFTRPEQSLSINLLLESHQKPATILHLWSWISGLFPKGVDLVWNPVGAAPGPIPAGFTIAEGHGPAPRFRNERCIANSDGFVLAAGDVSGWVLNYGIQCEKGCDWTLGDNCSYPGAPRLDPRQRLCKVTGEWKAHQPGLVSASKWRAYPPWSTTDDLSLVNCHLNPVPDGAGKFLAKPSEVVQYGWTILLPSQFDAQKHPVNYTNVHAEKAGKPVGTWRSYGFYSPDKSYRPIWRANQHPNEFPANVAIRATDKTGKVQCWKIHDPRVRND